MNGTTLKMLIGAAAIASVAHGKDCNGPFDTSKTGKGFPFGPGINWVTATPESNIFSLYPNDFGKYKPAADNGPPGKGFITYSADGPWSATYDNYTPSTFNATMDWWGCVCNQPGAYYSHGTDWNNNNIQMGFTGRVFQVKNETYWIWADGNGRTGLFQAQGKVDPSQLKCGVKKVTKGNVV